MKFATIEKIINIEPIVGADSIVTSTVLGWQVVVKKDEFSIGDLCVYIPIDTIVNTQIQCFSFLSEKAGSDGWMKIKPIKLRGCWSEGLVIPLTNLDQTLTYCEGMDVSEQLDVQKYEKENLITPCGYECSNSSKVITFPKHIVSITDEDNLKSNISVLKELLGLEMIGTRKQDGSSLTIIKRNDEFIVCSRRQLLDNTSVMYQYVEREKIMERMTAYGQNLAIQGEFCGPKVNGNHMCLSDYQYYVFNIKNLDTGSYLGYVDIVKMCDELKLQTVPVVFEHVCDETWTIAKFQAIANEQKYITPTGKKVPGEGIVVRSKIPVYSKVLRKNLSVKIINQNYKD